MNENKTIGTLADVLSLIDQTGLTGTRRRDMISAIKRICEMAGTTPECVCAGLPVLKEMLSRIRPAAHGVSAKSYSNLRSLWLRHLSLPASSTRRAGVAQYAPIERARRLRELVRRSGHLAGRGGRQRRSARHPQWDLSSKLALMTSLPL